MKLRIAEIHIPWQTLPVKKYGGSERVLYPLVEGLVKKGHDVTLFATGDTQTSAKLISVYPRSMYEDGIARKNTIYPLLNILEAVEKHHQFDILHFHLNVSEDYPALPLSQHIRNKTVFTVHFTAPSSKGYPERDTFLKKYSQLQYVSISNSQRKGMDYLNWIKTVYNGIDLREFTYNDTPEDYFVWMGKFNPDKGTKEAVLAAKKAGVKLLLGGAIDNLDGLDSAYYYQEIKPLIDDKQIVYVGEVGGKKKDSLLGNARAFLNPIKWNEPFGLVMAESLAVGTPVISLNNGAAPEIIKNNETGFIVNSVEKMAEKMKVIGSIDRKKCRARVEKYFSSESMVNNYIKVFTKVTKTQKMSTKMDELVASEMPEDSHNYSDEFQRSQLYLKNRTIKKFTS